MLELTKAFEEGDFKPFDRKRVPKVSCSRQVPCAAQGSHTTRQDPYRHENLRTLLTFAMDALFFSATFRGSASDQQQCLVMIPAGMSLTVPDLHSQHNLLLRTFTLRM